MIRIVINAVVVVRVVGLLLTRLPVVLSYTPNHSLVIATIGMKKAKEACVGEGFPGVDDPLVLVFFF